MQESSLCSLYLLCTWCLGEWKVDACKMQLTLVLHPKRAKLMLTLTKMKLTTPARHREPPRRHRPRKLA
jgi:hypothetical protein